MKKQKPKLSMLNGKKVDDMEALIKLFKQTTGRTPTQQEIDDAKKVLQS